MLRPCSSATCAPGLELPLLGVGRSIRSGADEVAAGNQRLKSWRVDRLD